MLIDISLPIEEITKLIGESYGLSNIEEFGLQRDPTSQYISSIWSSLTGILRTQLPKLMANHSGIISKAEGIELKGPVEVTASIKGVAAAVQVTQVISVGKQRRAFLTAIY